MKFEIVEEYLRKYSTEVPPYDPNGALLLFKAIVENLQEHFTDDDFDQYSASFNEKNVEFLKRLILKSSTSKNNK